MPNLTKIIAIATSIGTISGGIGLGVHLLSSNLKISNKLILEGFKLASTDEDWTTLFTAHELLKAVDDNVFKAEFNTTKDKSWLQAKCQEALNSDEKNETNYKLARQWCVKEEKASVILERTKKVLDSKSTTNDISFWTQKLDNLKENAVAISSLGISKNKAAIVVEDLGGKCTTINETKTTAKEFNKNFDLAREWCSVSKSST